jgi:type IV pilus modification protein PilV
MKTIPIIYDQKGVSLLEIMVGILILATGFLGVASLQTQALKGVQWAQHRTTANFLAQSYLESIPFDDLDNHHGSSNGKTINLDKNTFFVTINVDPLGTATQKTVEVTVSCLDRFIHIETIRFP